MMNQININYYKLKYFKYKLKYTLYKQNMFKDKNKLYCFNGVWAYSNDLEDKDECKLDELNYNNGYFTGIKWQCVEYARRYIQTIFGVTFSQVESAYEIPNAIFTRLEDNKIIETSIYNENNILDKLDSLNHSLDLLNNCLIIWPKDYEPDAPHGHVAIIVSANKEGESSLKGLQPSASGLYVAEQNYDNNNYYRFIPLSSINNVTIISINN